MNLLSKPVYAQVIGTLDPIAAPTLNEVITGLVYLALAVAGLLFFATLLLGGIRYLTAGGDEKATQEARRTLTNGVIGLIIVVASFLVSELLFRVFGLHGLIIFTDPTNP